MKQSYAFNSVVGHEKKNDAHFFFKPRGGAKARDFRNPWCSGFARNQKEGENSVCFFQIMANVLPLEHACFSY